eukprot:GHVR01184620.1.p1 GENE.GHVR01184620.1~~GHVR01184620.1.p1  ORF type:complete len:347 (-),score=46.93 GHVR01184620.1:749-1789(-)
MKGNDDNKQEQSKEVSRKIADPYPNLIGRNISDLKHCATDNKLNEITEDQTDMITSFTEEKLKETLEINEEKEKTLKYCEKKICELEKKLNTTHEESERALNEKEVRLKATEWKLEAIENNFSKKEKECATRLENSLQNVSKLEEEVNKCNFKLTATDQKLKDSVKKCEEKDKTLIECESTTHKLKEIIKARDESERALKETQLKLKETKWKLEVIENNFSKKEEQCATRLENSLQNVSKLEVVKKCNFKLTATDQKLKDSVKKREEVGVAKLCKACVEGSIPVVKCLVDTGVAVDCKNSDGRTPLFLASWKGQTKVVRFLLEKGGNLNERDKVRISLFISLFNSY